MCPHSVFLTLSLSVCVCVRVCVCACVFQQQGSQLSSRGQFVVCFPGSLFTQKPSAAQFCCFQSSLERSRCEHFFLGNAIQFIYGLNGGGEVSIISFVHGNIVVGDDEPWLCEHIGCRLVTWPSSAHFQEKKNHPYPSHRLLSSC